MMLDRMSRLLRTSASQINAARRSVLAGIAWTGLIACIYAPTASAGPTFPDEPGQGQKAENRLPPAEHHAADVPPPADRSRADIEEDIQDLEAQRTDLLAKYSSAHPDVRAVERRLQIRRKQLEMLKQTSGGAK